MHESEKAKAIKASTYTIFGFGFAQVLRFMSNLVLTRLLAPELFGLVATANLFIVGIALFSDIGLEPSIIRSSRADDPAFLNSAWTLQIIRCFFIAAIAMIISYPVALFYKEPLLTPLMCLIGANTIIGGFQSTSLVTLKRIMDQKTLTLMEIVIQLIGIACMIALAFLSRSIWSLLSGTIVSTIVRTVWSHRLQKDRPNKFILERPAIDEIMSFGKWILFSTAIMFLSTQIDRIILGKLLGMAWFGVYGIALNLADLPRLIVSRLNGSVVLPLVSKYSSLPHPQLRERIQKPRGMFVYPASVLLAILACFGDFVIGILFDARYHAASWIMPILIVGMWPTILMSTIDGCLLAVGKPKYSAIGNLLKFIYLIISMPVAYALGGQLAAVIAVALNGLLPFLIYTIGMIKEKLSLLRQDVLATLVFILCIGLFLGIRLIAGWGMTGVEAFMKA